MKLGLLRHALTTAVAGSCYGSTDVGVPAEASRAIAARVAPALPANTPLVSSPLQRCAGLAQAIAALRPELPLRVDARIAEMDFGAWEGCAWDSIARAELDAWTAGFADACPGGSGESTRRFMQRVGEAFDEWRATGRDALWVTHAGVIRAVWLLQEGRRCVERADEWPTRPIAFGEWIEVEA